MAYRPRRLSVRPAVELLATLPVKSLPANLPDGAYTLVARATDPTSLPADSASGPTLNVAPSSIALAPSFAKLTLPTSVAAGAKLHATATLKIINTGNDTALGP